MYVYIYIYELISCRFCEQNRLYHTRWVRELNTVDRVERRSESEVWLLTSVLRVIVHRGLAGTNGEHDLLSFSRL